jgi:hypothetical protein
MTSDLLSILNGLHDRHADFVIVGGVAAALHGGSRVTFDLDIVPSLDAESWVATVDLLVSLGAQPRIPEPLERIRDVTRIRTWPYRVPVDPNPPAPRTVSSSDVTISTSARSTREITS